MAVIELAFDDDPRRLAARPAHRERLARLHAEGVLRLAGPWSDGTGALLVPDTDDAAPILPADPYFTTPGVRVLSVRAWSPVVGR